jgi:transposase
MNSVEIDVLASVFLLPETIAIEVIYPTKTLLTIQVACRLKSAACPLCQHVSERIHGSYGRTVADVPCGGSRVTLALTVRKFVCGTVGCPRKIDPIAHSPEEYQTFLRSLSYEPVAKAAFGKKLK